MEMTFDQYIQNPMGKENAVISNRTMYRNLYQEKLDKILVREAGNVEIKAYHVGKRYICYLKIPSEVVPKFYYDVLIEFRLPKGILPEADLKKYLVRFWSNDPSFVYTFTHAFIKNDLFIKDFTDKMSKKAVKERAKEKNPAEQVGYVKSIYFAYLIMSKRGLFSKTRYVDKYSESALKREIMHADKKIKERQEAAEKINVAKRKDRTKLKQITAPQNNLNPETPTAPKRSNISRIGAVKPVKKTVGKIGSIKKTKRK